jgi:DNA (cytosine-5)-methyltransferase 1
VTLCDAVQLLPTPQGRDGDKWGMPHPDLAAARLASGRRNLEDAAALLPTTRARDAKGRDPNPRGVDLNEAVALLPTPTHRDGASGPGHATTAEGSPDLRTVVPALLPTPAAADAGHLSRGGRRAGEPLLGGIDRLLPTPRASDGPKGGPNQRGSAGDLMLPAAVQPERWGRYTAAVARWETATGNPAPPPTIPGTKGQPTLNPRLSEWMMGLPPGWLDIPGVSTSAQKAIAGNGVVPQQAAAALRLLLDLRAAADG